MINNSLLIWIILLSIVATCCKFLSFYLFSNSGTVDGHLWLRFSEHYKSQKNIPIKTPEYLIGDVRQYYPPFYYIYLSKFPNLINKYWKILPLVIPDIILVIIVLFIADLAEEKLYHAALLLLIYNTTPINIIYNAQINPRGFANVLLAIIILLFGILNIFSQENGIDGIIFIIGILFLIILLCSFIIITHKMTLQFLILIFFSIILINNSSFYLIVAIILGSLFITKKILRNNFLIKQFTGHVDLLLFHYRISAFNGANQVESSKIYGQGKPVGSTLQHKHFLLDYPRKFLRFISYNPSIIIPISLFYLIPYSWILIFYTQLLLILFILLWRRMFFLGSAYLYQMCFSAMLFPILLLNISSSVNISLYLYIIALNICIVIFAVIYRYVNKNNGRPNSEREKLLINYLNSIKKSSRILCIPVSNCERIATETVHSVLWKGGDSMPLKELEDFFPVLKHTIKTYAIKYNIDFVIIDQLYWKKSKNILSNELGCEPADIDNYLIFNLSNFKI
jgi:hypothetical protein